MQFQEVYERSTVINPVWTQQLNPEFDKALQDEPNIIKYEIPPVVQLSEFVLGFMYIGSSDCLKGYRVFRSRASYASATRHRVQKDSKVPVVIYSDGIIEVHNTEVEKIDLRIDGVWQRPTDLPTYNTESSDIPIDLENISKIRKMIVDVWLNPESKERAKFHQDNKDQTAI